MLDGRLDDPCWQQAARVPLGPPDQPVRPTIRLCTDGTAVYLGASFPSHCELCFQPTSTASDAAGAVDGVEERPLRLPYEPGAQSLVAGRSWKAASHREDRRLQPPGLRAGVHNADILVILTSDDGKNWTRCYDNAGRPFGGATSGNPLVVDFEARPPAGMKNVAARFVRIQLPSPAPIFLHLDEVEIYAPGDTARKQNLALWPPGRSEQPQHVVQGGRTGDAWPCEDRPARHRAVGRGDDRRPGGAGP